MKNRKCVGRPALAVGLCLSLVGPVASSSSRPPAADPENPHVNQPEIIAHEGASIEGDERLGYAKLKDQPQDAPFVLEAVLLEEDVEVDLALKRFDVLTPTAQVVVAGAEGEQPLDLSSMMLLRGVAAGYTDSQVFISATPHAVNGFIRIDGEYHIISSGPAADDFPLKMSRLTSLVSQHDHSDEPFTCSTDSNDPAFTPLGMPVPPSGGESGGSAPCRTAEIAIETDWEFTGNLFEGDTTASAAYAVTLLAAASEIYSHDLNVQLVSPYVRVWESNSDPYDAESTSQLLQQFVNYWRDHEDDVDRDLAHLLSGDALGGGIAYVGVLCSMDWGYAVSANLSGWFPYPIQDNHPANWDLMVVAHELGHNFGSGHTHNGYVPPLDNCGNGDCEDADNGTIMSYCHICPGGLANVAMHFHPQVVEQIHWYLDGACDINGGDGGSGTAILLDLLAAWGCTNCPYDYDGSGVVDTGDLLLLLVDWQPCDS